MSMYELCSTREMIENIKDVLSLRLGERVVFDRDVAREIGVTEVNIATRIKRDSPPLKEILLFCAKWRVDVKSITIKKSC